MKTPNVEADFSSVEWGWSFWLIVLIPAILAFTIGLYCGAKNRTVRAQSLLFLLPVLCLSLLFYFLWVFHAETVEQAKIAYFMKYENPPPKSSSGPPYDPVYQDWRTPGNKGFYTTIQDKSGSFYVRPPNWVFGVAPLYCIAFWTIGYLLSFARCLQQASETEGASET